MKHKEQRIDQYTLHQVLMKTGGDFEHAASFLKSTKEFLLEMVREDPALNTAWGEYASAQRACLTDLPDLNAITLREPASFEPDKADEAQRNFLLSHSLSDCGLTDTQVKQAHSFATLAGGHFESMVNISHGMLLKNAMEMNDRVEEIMEILRNDEMSEEKVTLEGGTEVTREVPKYSEAEKIKWQSELTSLLGELRKMTETSVNSQSLGQKLGELMKNQGDLESGRSQKKRLKPKPKPAEVVKYEE